MKSKDGESMEKLVEILLLMLEKETDGTLTLDMEQIRQARYTRALAEIAEILEQKEWDEKQRVQALCRVLRSLDEWEET